MSKKVFVQARIVLGGVDVSDTVMRWSVGGKVGELYTAELDLIKTDQLQIRRRGEHLTGGRSYTHNDVVTVGGVDISKWLTTYHEIASVKELDGVRLFIQADRDVLSINGTHPWEFAE